MNAIQPQFSLSLRIRWSACLCSICSMCQFLSHPITAAEHIPKGAHSTASTLKPSFPSPVTPRKTPSSSPSDARCNRARNRSTAASAIRHDGEYIANPTRRGPGCWQILQRPFPSAFSPVRTSVALASASRTEKTKRSKKDGRKEDA